MQVSLRDRLQGAVLAAVRAGVRDFEDRTGAIFPACSSRAEPESQSEVRKMSRDSRGRG